MSENAVKLPTIAERLEVTAAMMGERRRRGEETVECDVEWLLELASDARERIRELAAEYVKNALEHGALEDEEAAA